MSVSQRVSKWLAFKVFVALKLVLLLYKLLDSGAAKTLYDIRWDGERGVSAKSDFMYI